MVDWCGTEMKSKKIIILGCNGQVGSTLSHNFDPIYNTYPLCKEIADVSDREQLRDICKQIEPDIIINCAAIIDLKRARDNPSDAVKVNALGAMNAAQVASEMGARFIHMSTDYVFDGYGNRSYTEEDVTNPINIYGQSKQWGEKMVRTSTENYVILRTSWVYGGNMGSNFLTRLLDNYSKSPKLTVVNDEVSCPTYVETISECIDKIIRIDDIKGIYHLCDKGSVSRYDFAGEVFDILGKNDVELVPCKSYQVNGDITRPLYTPLDTNKLSEAINYEFKPWKERLIKCLKK
jgi:dTDP-4-dehydrorhamnose reductase